jgi:hypothetical protein
MKRWVLLLIGAISLWGASGCSHIQDYLDIARENGMSAEYLTALKRWTRSQIIYSQFETKAHIGATYRSPEFNRNYFREYARIYHLREGERRTGEDFPPPATSDSTEFIFYASLPEKTSNDFDRRGSVWTIFLVNGKGERIDPAEIRRIDPITPVITEFFPYINPYYGIAYRLRFPPLTETKATEEAVKLVFASVIGKVVLEFRVR